MLADISLSMMLISFAATFSFIACWCIALIDFRCFFIFCFAFALCWLFLSFSFDFFLLSPLISLSDAWLLLRWLLLLCLLFAYIICRHMLAGVDYCWYILLMLVATPLIDFFFDDFRCRRRYFRHASALIDTLPWCCHWFSFSIFAILLIFLISFADGCFSLFAFMPLYFIDYYYYIAFMLNIMLITPYAFIAISPLIISMLIFIDAADFIDWFLLRHWRWCHLPPVRFDFHASFLDDICWYCHLLLFRYMFHWCFAADTLMRFFAFMLFDFYYLFHCHFLIIFAASERYADAALMIYWLLAAIELSLISCFLLSPAFFLSPLSFRHIFYADFSIYYDIIDYHDATFSPPLRFILIIWLFSFSYLLTPLLMIISRQYFRAISSLYMPLRWCADGHAIADCWCWMPLSFLFFAIISPLIILFSFLSFIFFADFLCHAFIMLDADAADYDAFIFAMLISLCRHTPFASAPPTEATRCWCRRHMPPRRFITMPCRVLMLSLARYAATLRDAAAFARMSCCRC